MDLYYAYVSSLQYIYVRNYSLNAIVKRVSLLHFPTCMALVDYNSLLVSEEDDEVSGEGGLHRKTDGGERVLAAVGTREGKVLLMKVSSNGYQKMAETRGGLSYGSVTAVDVSV